jgi:hypothetical protein
VVVRERRAFGIVLVGYLKTFKQKHELIL